MKESVYMLGSNNLLHQLSIKIPYGRYVHVDFFMLTPKIISKIHKTSTNYWILIKTQYLYNKKIGYFLYKQVSTQNLDTHTPLFNFFLNKMFHNDFYIFLKKEKNLHFEKENIENIYTDALLLEVYVVELV